MNAPTSGTARETNESGEGGKASTRQAYLQWRAQDLPGRSCDPNGPVYLVLDSDARRASELSSDFAELLVHFGAGGKPEEIRIERSTGNEDLDARVAQAVCGRVRARNVDETLASDTGWAHLAVRVSDRRSRDD